MNVEEILDIVGDECDLNPKQSPDGRARLLRFLNLGVDDIIAKAPYLMRHNERHFTVPLGLKPTASEKFDVQADAWLLKLDSTDAAAVGQWRTDGTHATQAIYLTDSAGTRYKRYIQGVLLSSGEIYVSLTAPWPNTTDTGINWEVRTDDFYLPRSLELITAIRLADEINSWSRDVHLIGEYAGRALNNTLFEGQPWTAYPGGDLDVPQFGTAGIEMVAAGGAWNSYAPAVGKKLEYVFTVSWGSRPEMLDRPAGITTASGRLGPLVESPPSAVVTSTATVSGTAHRITVPDIRLLLAQSAGTRSDPSLVGYRVNIYRADQGSRFLYLHSLPAGTTQWDDDGTVVPDVFRQLPKAFGCRSLTFDATPTDQIIVDGVWEPLRLRSDEDTPPLNNNGIRALIELTIERVQRKLNNPSAAAAARVRFNEMLGDLSTAHGSGHDGSKPVQRSTARIGGDSNVFDPRHTVNYDWGS